MKIKVGKKDLVLAAISQFMQYGAAIFAIPVLSRTLNFSEIGLWYIFITINSFALLFEMGFTPTLSRYFTNSIPNGLQRMEPSKILQNERVPQTSVGNLVNISKKIYFLICIAVALVLGTLGTVYILSITPSIEGHTDVLIAWMMFCSATIINIYCNWQIAFLTGCGHQSDVYKSNIVIKSGFLIGVVCCYCLGSGILGISFVWFASIICGKAQLCLITSRRMKSIIENERLSDRDNYDYVFHQLCVSSYKYGLVSIAAFLIVRSGVFFATAAYGVAEGGRFAITQQVFMVIMALSQVVLTTCMPKMVQCRATNDMTEFRRLFSLSIVSAVLLYVLGAIVFVIMILSSADRYIFGTSLFLDPHLLALMAVMYLLELIYACSGMAITTGNKVPLVGSSLISALFILLGSLVVLNQQLPVICLILTQLTVQIAYNNWKWPVVIAQEIHLGFSDLWKPIVSIFSMVFKNRSTDGDKRR